MQQTQVHASESSILIRFARRNVLDRIFIPNIDFAVPELPLHDDLFLEEMIHLGSLCQRNLRRRGPRVDARAPRACKPQLPIMQSARL